MRRAGTGSVSGLWICNGRKMRSQFRQLEARGYEVTSPRRLITHDPDPAPLPLLGRHYLRPCQVAPR